MTEFTHPPTPPAIPVTAKLTGGTAAHEVATLIEGHWPIPREPFDPNTMSVGAVSVAALLEGAA